MLLPLRTELIGQYKTPRFKIGDIVTCGMRGDVRVVGLTDAKIPWPIGQAPGKGARGPVIYADLERALQVESNVAICSWWGVTGQTVTKWRKAIGVGPHTKSSRQLRAAYGAEPTASAARAQGLRSIDRTEQFARASAARKGVPRPEKVRRIFQSYQKLGNSQAARRKRGETLRRLGIRPPNGRKWSTEDDRMALELSPAEAAAKTGRSLKAVYARRKKLQQQNGTTVDGRGSTEVRQMRADQMRRDWKKRRSGSQSGSQTRPT